MKTNSSKGSNAPGSAGGGSFKAVKKLNTKLITNNTQGTRPSGGGG